MSGMYAAYIKEFGPASAIRYGRLPDPRPGPYDVLVGVEATTANHVDTFIRSGAVRTPVDFPFVVGRDLVGRVVSTGGGVTGFTPGQRVWCNSLGHRGRQGAAAERAVVPAQRLYPLPDTADPGTAVTLLHPVATAHLGLLTHGRLRPGGTAVVVGAAGNVGAAAVAVAARAGARVVAVARGGDRRYCASLGADAVLDQEDQELPARLAAACPGGADVYFDAAGANDLTNAVALLAPRGRIVLLAGLRSAPRLPVGPLYAHDRSVVGFAITNATVPELAAAAACVNAVLSGGRSPLSRNPRRLHLSATAEAHRMLEAGELRRGRVVLTVG
jgi:NADPH:quinone reductase-like Zn-dependent oxidoreductase